MQHMDIPAVLHALEHRVRTAGAEPLLTHYDLDSGGRTELSVTSYANWVAKTANLIAVSYTHLTLPTILLV